MADDEILLKEKKTLKEIKVDTKIDLGEELSLNVCSQGVCKLLSNIQV